MARSIHPHPGFGWAASKGVRSLVMYRGQGSCCGAHFSLIIIWEICVGLSRRGRAAVTILEFTNLRLRWEHECS